MSYSVLSLSHQTNILSLIVVISTVSIFLTGCSPSTYSVRQKPDYKASLPSTEIYFYPENGQNDSQQQRDRYECYLWAVKKSGFDPNQAQLAPHQRFEVKASPPPGVGTAVGAASGALLGSIASPRHRSVEGLVFGAMTGALLGAATDISRQQEANRIQRQYNEENTRHYAQLERQSRNYRRAISVCLEGRGYNVQ